MTNRTQNATLSGSRQPAQTTLADGEHDLVEMTAAFRRAADACPDQVHEMDFILGGRPARLRTVGRELSGYVGRPLSHLRCAHTPGTVPQLTIDLWDEQETGVGCPGCAVDDDLGIDGSVATSADGNWIAYQRARSRTLYDRAAGAMIGWSAYGDRACLYEMGRPLHVPLSLWHCDVGLQVVHSGLVARVDARGAAGVLFPGMGGSGKSTSSLTCLEAGLSYLGDDYIGLSEDGAGGFIGHSVYNSSHLEPHHLRRFARLEPHAIPARLEMEDKSLILLAEVFPGQFLSKCPIRAIAMPRVVNIETTRFRPASKLETMLALAPSSLVMIPGRGAAGMDRLAALVESVPCYRLELGRALESIPVAVRDLLVEATGS